MCLCMYVCDIVLFCFVGIVFFCFCLLLCGCDIVLFSRYFLLVFVGLCFVWLTGIFINGFKLTVFLHIFNQQISENNVICAC